MKIVIVNILIILICSTVAAQNTAVLTGIINDTLQKAVKGASIYVATPGQSYMTTTDENGSFRIQVLPGNYYLSITHTGYVKKEWPAIALNMGQYINMQTIILSASSQELKTVEVTAQHNQISTLAGGYRYNVPNTNLLTGKSLLNRLPGVNADNNSITLLGDNKIQVLINGSATQLAGKELVNYLQQLQGNSIESIEVYTNPPASFDANGSGVINIITRKSKTLGWTGNVNAGIGTHDKQNISQTLNLNAKKFILFETVSYSHYNERIKEESENVLLKTQERYHYLYRSPETPSNFLLAEAGGNFKPDSTNNIGFKISGTQYKSNYNSLSTTGNSTQNSSQFLKINNTRYNLNYKKQFHKKGQSLTGELNYYDLHKDQQDQISATSENFTQQSDTRIKIFNGKADITTPLSKQLYLQGGIKASNAAIDNDNINPLMYKEQIYAAYSILTLYRARITYNAGLRLENTHIQVITADSVVRNNYTGLYPSVNVSWRINSSQTISINASRRLSRPSYTQLNPFLDQSSVSNYRVGNPYLSPTNNYQAEGSYNLNMGENSFYTSAGYKRYDHIIEYITLPYQDSREIVLTTPRNIGKADYVYLTTYLSETLVPRLNTSLNLTGFYIGYKSASTTGTYTLSGKASVSYTLLKSTNITLDYNFQTPQSTPQGTANSYHYLDIALSTGFFNDKLSMMLSLSDIFNSNRNNYSLHDTNLVRNGYIKVESQIFKLAVSYRFGKVFKTQAERFKVENDNRSNIQK